MSARDNAAPVTVLGSRRVSPRLAGSLKRVNEAREWRILEALHAFVELSIATLLWTMQT
jgi:hypothetical protein